MIDFITVAASAYVGEHPPTGMLLSMLSLGQLGQLPL